MINKKFIIFIILICISIISSHSIENSKPFNENDKITSEDQQIISRIKRHFHHFHEHHHHDHWNQFLKKIFLEISVDIQKQKDIEHDKKNGKFKGDHVEHYKKYKLLINGH
ncbi:hypothetical protein PVAND_008744 [Polypedilum vanderplanki]|uniref:Uncharacterized protein n=1 Tax=Polypedilum vanderplanki TaxID=319348 RepID=A0A9J6CAJ0_POLVA|nr:hypothetical protein PVAND_008744 [Polypedilum vanderplanki]